MRNIRQVILGLVIALASIGIVIGGFSLSLAEGNLVIPNLIRQMTLTPTWQTISSAILPTFTPMTVSPSLLPPTSTPTLLSTVIPTLSPPSTNSPFFPTRMPTLTPIPCGPPPGWARYTVLSGDTLFSLSVYYKSTVTDLQRANCLVNSTLIRAGSRIYVPPGPTRTPSRKPTFPATNTPTLTPTQPSATPTETLPSAPTETSTDIPTLTPTPSFTPTNTP